MKGIRPAWVEVYLENCIHNFMEVKKRIKEETKVCTVVKADGYKLGAVAVSKAYIDRGTDMLAVAVLDEGIEIREEIKDFPILILGYTPEDSFVMALENNLILTIYTEEHAAELNKVAKKIGKKAKIHIKLETGMNRLGFLPTEDSLNKVKNIYKMENIEIEGIYSHLARADEVDKTWAYKQKERFDNFIEKLGKENINIPIKHIANSAAIIDLPDFQYDMVRPGIMLTGQYPSDEVSRENVKLKLSFNLKAKIANVKEIDPGEGVSYGHKFVADDITKVATLPLGYADGLPRLLSNRLEVSYKGIKCKNIGRICMDQCMINVTGIEDVKIGDEVILYGDGSRNSTTPDEVASILGTINYEILTMLDRRLPRVYK
ncbi:MAG: alanine racemase [Bacillota bacterium]|nr:alanine racemase [Bacillota bacterium]